VNRRMIIALLVVLALCLTVLAGTAGSTVQVGLADTDSELTGVLHKDSGGGFNGDDDRWGNTSPVTGDPDEVDPGNDETGSDAVPEVVKAQTGVPTFSRLELFASFMLRMFIAR